VSPRSSVRHRESTRDLRPFPTQGTGAAGAEYIRQLQAYGPARRPGSRPCRPAPAFERANAGGRPARGGRTLRQGARFY
jgi:hypothetical protein